MKRRYEDIEQLRSRVAAGGLSRKEAVRLLVILEATRDLLLQGNHADEVCEDMYPAVYNLDLRS